MTAGGELEEVQGVDGAGLDTGDVAEGAHESLAVCLPVVDDQGATALTVAAATHLALSGTELAGFLDFNDVGAGTDGLEERGGEGGLDQRGGFKRCAADHKRDFGDRANTVASGEEESGNAGCGDGGGGCEASESMLDDRFFSQKFLLTFGSG